MANFECGSGKKFGTIEMNMKVIAHMSAKSSTQNETAPDPSSASSASSVAARPNMLAYLFDAANLITMGGLALSFLACWLVLSQQLAFGLAFAAMALVMDYADGWTARRAVGRNPAFKHFGAHLDCFADFVTKGIFPALFLLSATDLEIISLPAALVYLMAIAVRYSYEFVPGRAHIGLSPDYLIVFLCVLQLAAPWLGSAFLPTLMVSLPIFAVLAVAPFNSPKLKGRTPIGFCVLLVLLSALLVSGSL
jgi:phosphatidylserine synthase